MKFFKNPYLLRRFLEPQEKKGYSYIPYEEKTLPMDIQTLEDVVKTNPDGSESVQRLKVFCDEEILVEDESKQQKADRVFFQGKWFECRSCRLSENTPLRHYTATFIQCADPMGDDDDES